MSTAQPPNSNELMDQASVQWARDNGYLLEDSCAGLQHLENNRVWATHDFTTHVQGPDQIPKTGGGYYDPLECPTWQDVEAWATQYASAPLPCNTTPQNFILRAPPAPPAPQNFNVVEWFNPNNSSTLWYVEINRRVSGVGVFQVVATVAVNGVSVTQQFADTSETQGVTYDYYLRYGMGTNAQGAATATLTRTAGP